MVGGLYGGFDLRGLLSLASSTSCHSFIPSKRPSSWSVSCTPHTSHTDYILTSLFAGQRWRRRQRADVWTLEGGRGRPESANGDAGVTAGDAEHSWEFAAEPGSSTWSPCGPEGGTHVGLRRQKAARHWKAIILQEK